MSDPISFTSTSPINNLPLLFAGQAQKELTVNEALSRVDALLHPVVEGEADTPPASPAAGECWLVGASPTGIWSGHAAALACFTAGVWIFSEPREGMRVFDSSAGQSLLYRGGWAAATTPAEPIGGTTIDAEARTAITGLITALAAAGILPES